MVDFAEVDPFKDFRYEDVFNIEDPFADEADQLEKNSSSMDEIFTTSSQHPAAGGSLLSFFRYDFRLFLFRFLLL